MVVNPFDDDAPVDGQVNPSAPPSQAEKVLAKFGGARSLARALQRLDPKKHRDPASIYKWTYPRNKGGTGGLIPGYALGAVLEAARVEGILLSPDDLYPGVGGK